MLKLKKIIEKYIDEYYEIRNKNTETILNISNNLTTEYISNNIYLHEEQKSIFRLIRFIESEKELVESINNIFNDYIEVYSVNSCTPNLQYNKYKIEIKIFDKNTNNQIYYIYAPVDKHIIDEVYKLGLEINLFSNH